MKRVFEDRNARDSAIAYAKLVLPHAEAAGADVEAMKDRMARWVTIVENYERDIAATWANTDYDVNQRANLVKTMRRAREQLMQDIFGR